MAKQFSITHRIFSVVQASTARHVPPRSRRIRAHLTMAILSCWVLITLSVMSAARVAAVPTVNDPPPQFMPGQVAPLELDCGDVDCYPPVDAHCYDPSEVNGTCLSTAFIPYNGKTLMLTLDIAARTIAFTSMPAPEYTLGDLLRAWGTPTGVSPLGRTLDVYWGTRSAHLTTAALPLDSRVDQITYARTPAFALPWRGFDSLNSASTP